ncbi:MAG: HAD hydrolase-like protein [Saprospiraceae bacterium]
MQFTAFVPARCGSKSIEMKNIKSFCGKPLLYWNLLALENTESVKEIYVATDCDTIEKVVLGFGFKKTKVYRRKEENAADHSSTESVMLEFINQKNWDDDDHLILVQATSPLTQSTDFKSAIKKMENADSLLTCVRLKRFYWNSDGTPLNYDFKNRPRRQDFDGILMENGAFYINSIKNILKNENRLSGKIAVYEMPEYTAVELDEPDDWFIAEAMMRKYILKEEKKPGKIKLFLTDVDGVLTDAGMYYSENGDELKKFNTHDGKGMQLLRESGVKTGIITSEDTNIVSRRAKKLKVDYLAQGQHGMGKLETALSFCEQEGISIKEVAYIGDDINCRELLSNVGLAACPANALSDVKKINGIILLEKEGGAGVVREFAHRILKHNEQFT